MGRSDIEFKTIDNVTLRGWMFKPADAEGKHACLIITHGLTCLKEMHLDTLAERLTSVLPIVCLVYDHRGYGASDQKDNEPRSEVVPAHQNSDLQDAITYSQSREVSTRQRLVSGATLIAAVTHSGLLRTIAVSRQ